MTIFELAGQIGGIAGVIAVVMFLIYRQDRKSSERQQLQDRRFMEDRLTDVLSHYSEDCRRHSEAFSELKGAVKELTVWLKAKNGSS